MLEGYQRVCWRVIRGCVDATFHEEFLQRCPFEREFADGGTLSGRTVSGEERMG